MIASISQKFVNGVGFSNGCALFTLYQPPPLVKSCLMDSSPATRPTGICWADITTLVITATLVMTMAPLASFTCWSTMTAAPLLVIGTPLSSSFGTEMVNGTLLDTGLP